MNSNLKSFLIIVVIGAVFYGAGRYFEDIALQTVAWLFFVSSVAALGSRPA